MSRLLVNPSTQFPGMPQALGCIAGEVLGPQGCNYKTFFSLCCSLLCWDVIHVSYKSPHWQVQLSEFWCIHRRANASPWTRLEHFSLYSFSIVTGVIYPFLYLLWDWRLHPEPHSPRDTFRDFGLISRQGLLNCPGWTWTQDPPCSASRIVGITDAQCYVWLELFSSFHFRIVRCSCRNTAAPCNFADLTHGL
jgi:hypothetical protein